MGQYHNIVSLDRREFLNPHDIGCGLKAWEMIGGGIPTALTWLLAARPGNMPADLSGDLGGAWAGSRVIAAGDYAEDEDFPNDVLPMSQVYGACESEPTREYCTPAEYRARLNEWRFEEEAGRHFKNVTLAVRGVVEEGASVRFCGSGWLTEVVVMPYAEKDAKGNLHYVLPEMPQKERQYLRRMCGIKEDARNPEEAGLRRWPWDRPPANKAWSGVSAWRADEGQARVFANLDRREFFDPAAFGEVNTTAGIMRATTGNEKIMAMDMVISPGGVESNKRFGKLALSSAGFLTALLFHPEPRGGGDIDPEEFAEVGRWRGNRLVLTSAYASQDLPSTEEVRESFTDIAPMLAQASAKMAA